MITNFAISVESKDVGGTQEVTIYLNRTVILSYQPGTGYPEVALLDAEETISKALRSLLSVHFSLRWPRGFSGPQAGDLIVMPYSPGNPVPVGWTVEDNIIWRIADGTEHSFPDSVSKENA